jgi:hypothetical protein
MFKLFERQPNWALKQLVQETDQPAVCLLIAFVIYNFPLSVRSSSFYCMSRMKHLPLYFNWRSQVKN